MKKLLAALICFIAAVLIVFFFPGFGGVSSSRQLNETGEIGLFDQQPLRIVQSPVTIHPIYRQGELTQITEDHTYVNSLVKAGVITRKQARKHENKNMITRAIGAEYRVEADQFVTPVSKGDIVLMCTDGLYDELSSEEISAKLGEEISMSDMCCDLIDMANEHGGNDNITVICLKVTEDDADE